LYNKINEINLKMFSQTSQLKNELICTNSQKYDT